MRTRAGTTKHVILFLAAGPDGTGRGLEREAHSIHVELRRSGYRDRFEFVPPASRSPAPSSITAR